MPQPKGKDWLNRYKNKIPKYATYKRHTPRQILIKLTKVKQKEQILKAARENNK